MTQKSTRIDRTFVLTAMLQLLERGWTQFALARTGDDTAIFPDEKGAVAFDIMGAYACVEKKYSAHLNTMLQVRLAICTELNKQLPNYLYAQATIENLPFRVTEWNDMPTRQHREVLNLIKDARGVLV